MPNINWGNAGKQLGDTLNPFNGATDYDVFSDVSVSGGDRNPVNSTYNGINFGIGGQGQTRAQNNGGGTFWQGQDGNVYVAGNRGVNAAGQWDSNSSNYWSSQGYRQIQDPNPTNNGQKNEDRAVLGASANASQSPWTPQDQGLYDYYVGQANSALNRLPNQFNTAKNSINTGYNQNLQSVNQGIKNAQGQRDRGITTNQQNYRTTQNQINQTASTDRQNLLRMLSSMGAGGGSEAQYTFPQLVGEQAAQQLGGAAQTQAQNLQGIDTAYNTYVQDADRQKNSLLNQRDAQLRSAEQTMRDNKTNLLERLESMKAQRAKAMGGDVVGALEPIGRQITENANRIDELQNFTPRYTGEVADYVAPELSSFTPAQSQRIQGDIQQNAAGGRTPLLDLLMGRDDRKDQSNVLV